MKDQISNLDVILYYIVTRDPDRARGQALSMYNLMSIGTPGPRHQNGQKSP